MSLRNWKSQLKSMEKANRNTEDVKQECMYVLQYTAGQGY